MMQKLEGEFAEWYNLRKGRSGAFWTDRYHCTMVDGGDYAWNCMQYIDLNMVRAGVVAAPKDWRWCGYDELTGRRRRYRLLDWKAILGWHPQTTQEDFSRRYETAILTAVRRRELGRNPIWTESLAVGGETFVARVAERLKNRRVLEQTEVGEGVWVVREGETPYTPLPGAGNAS
jgi:putative transposase